MTKDERLKTIDYLRDVVFKLEDRPDHERLQENIDRLKGEIKKLEEQADALRFGSDESFKAGVAPQPDKA